MENANYKMTIAYDGTRYLGWEHQPNTPWTIQGKLEEVLSRMVDAPVEVIGAGRTDAGVHARAMTANVHLMTRKSEEQIRDYMNHYLPEDICIRDLRRCAGRFHARYNALGKTYRYACYAGELKPVFDRKYVWTLEGQPDVAKMRAAAGYLTGEHDFASFCGNPRMKKSTVRRVDSIRIEQNKDRLTLTFHGSGFLQYMVRILSGTLLEVGFGRMAPEDMVAILEERDRQLAGPTAPACGLTLMKVDY